MGSTFFEENFSSCISLLMRKLFKFSHHGCRNCIFWVERNVPIEKIFEIHVFFQFRKLDQTFSEIWCENSEKVVRTALYVPGEIYQDRNFLWKKILTHFRIPGWSFPGLWREFFDMIFKSELQVSKKKFFVRKALEKKWNICILGHKVKYFWQKRSGMFVKT